MAVTIDRMAKSEQIRVRSDLAKKARHVAMELHGESLPEYVERVLSEALARDFPATVKLLAEQVEGTAADSPKEPKKGRKGQ